MRAVHPDCYTFQWRPYRTILLYFCTSRHLTQTDAVCSKGNFLTSAHSTAELENSLLLFESSN